MGSPDPARIGDAWIWAEFWTRYYTDREPQCTWVVVPPGGGEVVGYLNGTCDARRVRASLPWLVPGMMWRVVSRRLFMNAGFRRAMHHMLESVARGEMNLPPGVAERYPAEFHFNLLPRVRRQGVGGRLLDQFVTHLAARGVPGIHAQAPSSNEPVSRFLASQGFTWIASWPLHAFRHVDAGPMELHTWVKVIA
jgi:ribosomal protein S18 acetylase RimI-like enzyme